MNEQYKLRTRLKHLYFRFKKNFLNFRLNLITYSKYLKLKNSEFLSYKNLAEYYKTNKIRILEGNSTQSLLQTEFLKKYKENFTNVLEIGFNAGHSSEIFLSSNPNSIVTSIDIGYWYYGKFGVEFLKCKYPNRLKLIFKDSILALKDFSNIQENKVYNFIYIDGNHTYEYAYNDIKNCKKFSNHNTLVAIDDVVLDERNKTLANTGPTQAWLDLLKEGFITEIEVAHFQDINRGVAVCKFVF